MRHLRRKRWRCLIALALTLCFALVRLEASLPDWDGSYGGGATASVLLGSTMDHGNDHPPGEAPHACHCAHAHDNVLAVAPEPWPVAEPVCAVTSELICPFVSAAPLPSFRPPIV